jgi:hypothetical protein
VAAIEISALQHGFESPTGTRERLHAAVCRPRGMNGRARLRRQRFMIDLNTRSNRAASAIVRSMDAASMFSGGAVPALTDGRSILARCS